MDDIKLNKVVLALFFAIFIGSDIFRSFKKIPPLFNYLNYIL